MTRLRKVGKLEQRFLQYVRDLRDQQIRKRFRNDALVQKVFQYVDYFLLEKWIGLLATILDKGGVPTLNIHTIESAIFDRMENVNGECASIFPRFPERDHDRRRMYLLPVAVAMLNRKLADPHHILLHRHSIFENIRGQQLPSNLDTIDFDAIDIDQEWDAMKESQMKAVGAS